MTTYKQAGVNIDAGNELVRIIRKTAPSIGGFSGLYPLEKTNLLLSATTDGVGTKLKLAFLLDKHDTVGIDLVAMSVNDLICCGAKPLLFLDYFATSRLDLKVAGAVIKGINDGCKQAGCLLIGGETAEMPGFYRKGEYDLSGFAVGTVERGKVIDGSKIKPGDVVIGLPSSGLHSNGFSMVHKVLSRGDLKKYGKTLIAPTRIYVKKVLGLLSRYKGIKGVANVTGGAFYEKIARVLPSNCDIVIDKNSWKPQEIFNILKRKGNIADKELYRVFNMGIGMALIVDKSFADKVRRSSGDGIIIGEVVRGSKSVKIV